MFALNMNNTKLRRDSQSIIGFFLFRLVILFYIQVLKRIIHQLKFGHHFKTHVNLLLQLYLCAILNPNSMKHHLVRYKSSSKKLKTTLVAIFIYQLYNIYLVFWHLRKAVENQ